MRWQTWLGRAGTAILVSGAAAASFAAAPPADPLATTGFARLDQGAAQIRESQLRQQAPAPPQAAPSQPTRVETTVYDAWVVTCREAGSAKKTCMGMLRVMTQDRKQTLLAWQLSINDQGRWVTSVRVPPGLATKKDNRQVGGGIALQSGLEIKFGNGQPRKLAYTSCHPQVCVAEALVDDAFIRDATNNATATITVHTVAGGGVPFELSIKGVDKAVASLRK
jgi:invasion protein IalB